MGYVIWKSNIKINETNKAMPIWQKIIFALSVSLLNPHAFLNIIGVIGTSALKYVGTEQFLFIMTCIIVSWICFFGLTLTGMVMKKIDSKGSLMNIFNKCSALYLFIGLI